MLSKTTLVITLLAATTYGQGRIAQGPFVGHLTPDSVSIWARLSEPGPYSLVVTDGSGGNPLTAVQTARPGADLCVVWRLGDLEANHQYRYRIEDAGGRPLAAGDRYRVLTPKPLDEPSVVHIAFGSCADEGQGTGKVWQRMAAVGTQAVVLLGDTPYIDDADLAVQRRRYGEFAAAEAMAALLGSTPWYATWDDHDFGRNDVDGRLPGKANSRRAFVEYHANPSYGDGTQGIYTSFRRGPIEVFLLDTRYFAATEPSPFAMHEPSLLGRTQWDWLRQKLADSTAPFKVLACGMVWNAALRPGKVDSWGSYPHERRALFEFIGENRITGVILVGGDVHRSRVIRHEVAGLAGYDLTELITSPMHDRIIAAANAPHPGLVMDMGEPYSFLLLTADSARARLSAKFSNAAGDDLYTLELTAAELSSR
jgi:alkaline phosphatase D